MNDEYSADSSNPTEGAALDDAAPEPFAEDDLYEADPLDSPEYRRMSDKEQAAYRMLQLVKAGNFVVLDTETTGLDFYNDVPCQIAVVAPDGSVLLDTLVKPHIPISAGAVSVHGITDETVRQMPNYADIHGRLMELCGGREVIIYNADYDMSMLRNAIRAAGIDEPRLPFVGCCAMYAYAEFHGDWNDYHENYRWQKLDTACRRLKVEVEAPEHSALGDALRTLGVIKAMAQWSEKNNPPGEPGKNIPF